MEISRVSFFGVVRLFDTLPSAFPKRYQFDLGEARKEALPQTGKQGKQGKEGETESKTMRKTLPHCGAVHHCGNCGQNRIVS